MEWGGFTMLQRYRDIAQSHYNQLRLYGSMEIDHVALAVTHDNNTSIPLMFCCSAHLGPGNCLPCPAPVGQDTSSWDPLQNTSLLSCQLRSAHRHGLSRKLGKDLQGKGTNNDGTSGSSDNYSCYDSQEFEIPSCLDDHFRVKTKYLFVDASTRGL